ncbi:MAG TPA: DUF5131 family protein [Ramlibacter sp.]|nr:DUF5131 family protein [Ramlibacter sp.]
MGETTGIAWTDHTANPWIGCTKVSAGCAHCYAETYTIGSGRGDFWGADKPRSPVKGFRQNVRNWNRKAVEVGERRRVFPSLCDPFEDHADANRLRPELLAAIAETPALDWQLLTKRPENVLRMVPDDWWSDWPANVWLGTSVENQRAADKRLPFLLEIPAGVRFLSCEPLLGKIDLDLGHWAGGGEGAEIGQLIHWVIVGGESGPGHRPMDLAWARDLREQCALALVPMFFKQTGGARPSTGEDALGEEIMEWPRTALPRSQVHL